MPREIYILYPRGVEITVMDYHKLDYEIKKKKIVYSFEDTKV